MDLWVVSNHFLLQTAQKWLARKKKTQFFFYIHMYENSEYTSMRESEILHSEIEREHEYMRHP